ncbi:MAG: SHOCT domain-containing protein [Deltaproteobacteria bacterium]|nr:SHOCT domain-containing protein [Deltaproteobacteria bacterium]
MNYVLTIIGAITLGWAGVSALYTYAMFKVAIIPWLQVVVAIICFIGADLIGRAKRNASREAIATSGALIAPRRGAADRLQELDEIRASGLITDAEWRARREAVLGEI